MAVYVGIDVHKKYCQAALMNDHGRIIQELRFDNTQQGAISLVTLARTVDSHVKAVVEPSANFWIRIYDQLEDEGIDVKLSNPDHQILQSNLQVMETLNSEVRNADIQIAKDATSEEKAKLLMTMPGVDYYAAMVLLSEIGDVHRFSSDEKLVSWVGLAPQTHQSGESNWTGHISRKGSKRARWTLGQCAQSAGQHDPRMREFYERIERKHGSQKAIVAVARKMLTIMYVMLIRNEPYHGENPELTEQKHKRLDTLANSA